MAFSFTSFPVLPRPIGHDSMESFLDQTNTQNWTGRYEWCCQWLTEFPQVGTTSYIICRCNSESVIFGKKIDGPATSPEIRSICVCGTVTITMYLCSIPVECSAQTPRVEWTKRKKNPNHDFYFEVGTGRYSSN